MGIRRITHSWAPLYRRHVTDYCCKHERRWNAKRIVPKLKRVAGQHSTLSQAASLSLLCAKPATEPEAALRRLTFVYQTTLLLHSSSQLALQPIIRGTGMLMQRCPVSSAARHHDQQAHWLKQVPVGYGKLECVASSLCLIPVSISKILVPPSNYTYFIKGL